MRTPISSKQLERFCLDALRKTPSYWDIVSVTVAAIGHDGDWQVVAVHPKPKNVRLGEAEVGTEILRSRYRLTVTSAAGDW